MIGLRKLRLVSADAHMGGTRNESQRDSAGEARYNTLISCHISHQQQSRLYQAIVSSYDQPYNNNFDNVNQRQIQLSTDLIKAIT